LLSYTGVRRTLNPPLNHLLASFFQHGWLIREIYIFRGIEFRGFRKNGQNPRNFIPLKYKEMSIPPERTCM